MVKGGSIMNTENKMDRAYKVIEVGNQSAEGRFKIENIKHLQTEIVRSKSNASKMGKLGGISFLTAINITSL